MTRKFSKLEYGYEYRVYSCGYQVGVYSSRKEAQCILSQCKVDDKYSYIQVVCYEYERNGSVKRIGYGMTQKEAKSDLEENLPF